MIRVIPCSQFFVVAFVVLITALAPRAAEVPGQFDAAARALVTEVSKQLATNLHEGLATYEKGIREKLLKQFPERPEPWAMLLEVAANWNFLDAALKPVPENLKKTRDLLNEIIQAPNAATTTREHARAQLSRLDRLGKPLAMQFEALPLEDQGARAVELAKMRGQVVLISYWATWCGPCVAELDSLLSLYTQNHKKGDAVQFEIVGISADRDAERLRRFVRENRVAWPQHFDGKGWQNRFLEEHGITIIPTMWLLDKAGNLRDLNARHDLAAKIKTLLAEPTPAAEVVPPAPTPTPTPKPPEKTKAPTEVPPSPKGPTPPPKAPEPKS